MAVSLANRSRASLASRSLAASLANRSRASLASSERGAARTNVIVFVMCPKNMGVNPLQHFLNSFDSAQVVTCFIQICIQMNCRTFNVA